MKIKITSTSAFFTPRFLISFAFGAGAISLALLAFGFLPGGLAQAASLKPKPPKPALVRPDVVSMAGPVSQDLDLRDLPYIAPNDEQEDKLLLRHPFPLGAKKKSDPLLPVRMTRDNYVTNMPGPIQTFAGMTQNLGCGGCLPPDTDGDVGPNHYIQSVNSSIRIHDKTGNVLAGPITYNSFFVALGTSTPCGNNQNGGDGIVFYDHMADRWIVSDFAFPAFPGTSFWQCIGVSKTGDPVSGGWNLYAVQVDPANPNYLGDYPKFGLWPDAYYLSMNEFSNGTTFNGVRVYALDRNSMINGGSANAIGFSILPADLGDQYSLVAASFRTGNPPPVGQAEWFMDVNSSATAGTVETQVFVRRFHVDFVTPANSVFGVGAGHTPDGIITVNGFVDAFDATNGTNLVPQPGTNAKLDTLGDKIMYPMIYQNLGGVESIYADQTINNNQGGTGPTAIRWYQFNMTGNTIPATPAQQQTFDNGADGLWRCMPSINVDGQGNVAIGYTASAATVVEPSIRYAGRLATDPLNTMAQGEAIMTPGTGHETNGTTRWGDYSTMFVDPSDSCTFYHTNEYFSAVSSAAWNTRVGSFRFSTCTGLGPVPSPTPTATPPAPTPTPTGTPIATPTPSPTPSPTPPASAGPVTVTATAGTLGPVDYGTVQAAFAAINAGTHQGNIAVWVMGDTTETVSAVLNASGSGSALYTSVLMLPNGTRTVSGSLAAPLIDLNGAKNVRIDGYGNMTLSNTSTAATADTSTIRFINGASSDIVANCSIQGAGTTVLGTAGGTIEFSTTTGTGNNNNVVFGNNIGPAGGNSPTKAIFGLGTTTNFGTMNTGNVIDTNNIFDVFNAATSVSAVHVLSGNWWTISNNHIYQTAPRTFTGAALRYAGITLNSTVGAAQNLGVFTVTGNVIGFGAANGTGTTTISGADNEFRGIDGLSLNISGQGTASRIIGNTISGINQTSSRNSTATTGACFIGIAIGTGTNGEADVIGNQIGSTDGSSTIVITETSTTTNTAPAMAMHDFSTRSNQFNYNQIGNITLNSGGTGTTVGFRGLLANTTAAANTTINNNTIANVTDNIVGAYAAYGIQMATGNGTITNNTIRNITGNATIAATVVGSGIAVNNTAATGNVTTVSHNTIHSLSNNAGAASNSIYAIDLNLPQPSTTLSAATLVGATNIKVASVANMVNGAQILIEPNTANAELVTITSVGTAGAGGTGVNVTPALAIAHASASIVWSEGTVTGNLIDRNFIHSNSMTSTDTTCQIWGIVMRGQGKTTVQNNMIRLGLDAAGSSITTGFSIIGIRDINAATVSYLYNSIYIGGTNVISASNTFAFNSSVVLNPRVFRNNIFWNDRSNASGGIANVAVAVAGTAANPPGLTMNNNDLYAPGTDGVVGIFNATIQVTLANWQAAVGQDASSLSTDPLLVNPTGTAATVDLHLQNGSPMIAGAAPITSTNANPSFGVTNDIDGDNRNPVTPDIGADERTSFVFSLVSAVSRLNHVGVGDFDIAMPLTGPSGVECRSNGGTYSLVVTFNGAVTSGTATVTAGTGVAGAPVFAGNTMTIPLTGVTDQQVITVTLSNVNTILPNTNIKVGFLIGDTTGDRFENSADIAQTKSRSGQVVGASNFRSDVNIDGSLNSADISLVKSKSGNAIP